jgi:hypothetical protein
MKTPKGFYPSQVEASPNYLSLFDDNYQWSCPSTEMLRV